MLQRVRSYQTFHWSIMPHWQKRANQWDSHFFPFGLQRRKLGRLSLLTTSIGIKLGVRWVDEPPNKRWKGTRTKEIFIVPSTMYILSSIQYFRTWRRKRIYQARRADLIIEINPRSHSQSGGETTESSGEAKQYRSIATAGPTKDAHNPNCVLPGELI